MAATILLIGQWAWFAQHPWINDAHAYWGAWAGGLYDVRWPAYGSYIYSPAFAEFMPTFLPFALFWAAWCALQIAALAWMVGPVLAVVLIALPFPELAGYGNPIRATIYNGNLELLLAAAVVAGMRYPAAWAFVLLTKVTPGVGLLWFAVRREWREAAIALGATAAVVAVSFVFGPGLWFEWAGALARGGSGVEVTPVPSLAVRLPLAAVVVVVGALRGWRWTVGVAAWLALPGIGWGGYAVLVAALALRHPNEGRHDRAAAARAGDDGARPRVDVGPD